MAEYAIDAKPTPDSFNMGKISISDFTIAGTTYNDTNGIILDIREFNRLGFQLDTADNDATYFYRVQGIAIEYDVITEVGDSDFLTSGSGTTGQDIVSDVVLTNTTSQIIDVDFSESIATAVRVSFRNSANSGQEFTVTLRSFQK